MLALAAVDSRGRRIGGEGPQIVAQLGQRRGRHGRAMGEMLAARVGRVGHVGQRGRRVGLGEVGIAAGQLGKRLRRAGRERQQVARPLGAAASGCWLRAAASSRITWALVPPKPKALTPARRGSAPRGQSRMAVGISIGASSSRSSGLTVFRCRCGGIWPCRSISTTLISPAMPAALSRWPMLVLTEPTTSGWSAGRPCAKHGAEGLDLDRVAQPRAGAVGFDVADVGGRQAGVGQRGADHRLLGGPLGADSPLLRPSWLTAVPRISARMRSPCGQRRR